MSNQKDYKCRGCYHCHEGITSAGCLMVDRKQNVLLLLKDKCKQSYTDSGGRFEHSKHRSALECANQELYEETRRLVRTDLSNCPFIEFKCGKSKKKFDHMYRMYVLDVNGPDQPKISCKAFYAVDERKLDYDCQEMSRLSRFPIDQFKEGDSKNSPIKLTQSGREEKLHKRVSRGIKYAIGAGYI